MSEEELYYLYTRKDEKKEKKKLPLLPFFFLLFLLFLSLFLFKKRIVKHRPWEKPEEITSQIIESMKEVKSFSKKTKALIKAPNWSISFEAEGNEGFLEQPKTEYSFSFSIEIEDEKKVLNGKYDFAGFVRTIGNDVFLKFSQLPEKDFFGNSLSQLKNTWIKIDPAFIIDLEKEIVGDNFILDPQNYFFKVLQLNSQLIGFKGFKGTIEELFAKRFFILKEDITNNEDKKNNLSHYRIVLNKDEIEKSISQMSFAAQKMKNEILFQENALGKISFFNPYSQISNSFINYFFNYPYFLLSKQKNDLTGEIWFDKKTNLIKKIVWDTEIGTLFYRGIEGKIVFYLENEYNDYNKSFTVVKPSVNKDISEIIKEFGYHQKLKEIFKKRASLKRDLQRRIDIFTIASNLFAFYRLNQSFPSTSTMPFSLGTILKDPGQGPCNNYFWIPNQKDNKKFCVFACLENGNFFAANEKDFKETKKRPTKLDCF